MLHHIRPVNNLFDHMLEQPKIWEGIIRYRDASSVMWWGERGGVHWFKKTVFDQHEIEFAASEFCRSSRQALAVPAT